MIFLNFIVILLVFVAGIIVINVNVNALGKRAKGEGGGDFVEGVDEHRQRQNRGRGSLDDAPDGGVFLYLFLVLGLFLSHPHYFLHPL